MNKLGNSDHDRKVSHGFHYIFLLKDTYILYVSEGKSLEIQ